MKPASISVAGELRAALLAYQRSRGRAAGAEQAVPLPLASIRDVLQLASGRLADGGPETDAQRAACFYIRSVLLRPGADHYALLGVEPNADAATIKDHYRLMMRLLHPDFSAGMPTAWPADAASRVNLAYEVLSSPQLRHEYDGQFAGATPAPKPVVARRSITTRPAPLNPPVRHPRQRLKQLSLLFGGGAALALLVAFLATGPTESLVQRAGGVHLSPAVPALPAPPPEPATSDRHVAGTPPTPAVVSDASPANTGSNDRRARQSAPLSTGATPATAQAAPASTTATSAAAPPSPASSQSPVALAPADSRSARPGPPAPSASAASGPTLAECHPVFAMLLQQMESGWGDRVLGMLDRQARATPATQALIDRYNAIVDERRPVTLSGIAFNSQTGDGRLTMSGRVLIRPRGEPEGGPPRELAFQAEFASRDGRVVLTRLAPVSE